MKNLVLSIILLCLFPSAVFSQYDYSFVRYSADQGFGSPIVRSIIGDKEGFIWFGTVNSIYRFDGFNFKAFGNNPKRESPMTHGFANILYEDRKGNLWVGATGGLNKFNRATEEFKQYIPDPSGPPLRNDIWSIYEDRSDRLWVGASVGLYYLDPETGKLIDVKPANNQEYLENKSFHAICEDKQGFLWIGNNTGLIKYDKNTGNVIPFWTDPYLDLLPGKSLATNDYTVNCIYQDSSGIMWIGSFGGHLLKLDPLNGTYNDYLLGNKDTSEKYPIMSICKEGNDKIWIGTNSGLILFDKSKGRTISHFIYDENSNQSISDNKVSSVFKDKSGALWIGTLSGGLNKLNRTEFPFRKIVRKEWAADKSYQQVPFQDMVVSRSGNLLVGTMQGVEEIDPSGNLITVHKPFKAINVLMEDSKGNLWIGVKQYSGGGLYKRDAKGDLSGVKDSTGNIFNKEIFCFYEYKKGRIFFAAEFYLFEIDPQKNTTSLIFRNKARILSMGEDRDGTLWLATMAGGAVVLDIDAGAVKKHFMPEADNPGSISDNSVISVYLDSKENLWVGTSLGLNKYDRANNNFKVFNNHLPLFNIPIRIVEDKRGYLWSPTAAGITRFNPDNSTYQNYDISYGLVTNYNYAAGKDSSGRIFFKGRKGITYIEPDSIKNNQFIPPVVLTRINIFNESFPISKEVTLSHSQNYISFEFAALSYISPEKNQYAYKMEGLDKDWVNSGNRRYAAYTDLKPGRYLFRVKASNNDGIWNNEGTSLSITILPPWWKTYWAYGIYFLFIGLLIFSWRKYDLKRQDLKYQLKLEHAHAEEHEKISKMKSRFFTNISHEFRTPLTHIIGPAEKIIKGNALQDNIKQAGLIKKNALRLLGLINQLLDISRIDEGKLKLQAAKHNIVPFIKGLVMNFESYAESRDIVLKVKSNNEIIEVYYDREKMERILLNILSNSFKFTAEGGRITVDICEMYTNKVNIKISDTGIGIPESELPKLFDRFYQVDGSHTRPYEGTGVGLALTKELVDLHKGKINVNSKEGEGTEIIIELLLGRDHFEESDMAEDRNTETGDEKYRIVREYYDSYLTGNLIELSDNQEVKTNGEKLIVLIVEDNADVRRYICDTIGDEFQIEEASNGDQGIRKAKNLVPDLIIGDIMMPGMDGYEMTRILKNDMVTSHIPIILLTAKSDKASKLEGLATGADDYIIKPFDIEELKLRIYNLIKIRRTLQEKIASGARIPTRNEEHKLSGNNEKFMCRVIEVIEKHISEEEFNIEDFGKEVGLSRTQLHRKIKALTGKSASRYIRSFRLSTAKQMIEEAKGNISEIAYSVGFSSPVYFSKCFKDEYGYPPSELKLS